MKPPNIFERLEQSRMAKAGDDECEHSSEIWCSNCVWPKKRIKDFTDFSKLKL